MGSVNRCMKHDEFALIRLLTSSDQHHSNSNDVVVGIGDDAAVCNVRPSYQLVMSCDTMVQEVHFTSSTMGEEDIGFKLMASNISDIAAMGGIPRYALVALSTPKEYTEQQLQAIYKGLYACAEQYHVAVIGGDTTSAPAHLTLTVTITGEVEQGKALLRSTAQPGDLVFVTGSLGNAAAGLDYLIRKHQDGNFFGADEAKKLVDAHQRPLPQVQAGRLLLQSGFCHALNDVSDGLASESWEIAEASRVGLILYKENIPMEASLLQYAQSSGHDPMDWVLNGGEDYQLLGTVDSKYTAVVKQLFHKEGLPFYIIGEVVDDFIGVKMKDEHGNLSAIEKQGYNHFSKG